MLVLSHNSGTEHCQTRTLAVAANAHKPSGSQIQAAESLQLIVLQTATDRGDCLLLGSQQGCCAVFALLVMPKTAASQHNTDSLAACLAYHYVNIMIILSIPVVRSTNVIMLCVLHVLQLVVTGAFEPLMTAASAATARGLQLLSQVVAASAGLLSMPGAAAWLVSLNALVYMLLAVSSCPFPDCQGKSLRVAVAGPGMLCHRPCTWLIM
jgi:hypothetical protein